MSLEAAKKIIRDMLRLAKDSGAAEGEIRNAVTMAKRLMDKHHLSEEDVADDIQPEDFEPLDLDDVEFAKEATVCGANKISAWEQYLATFVIEFIGGVGCCVDPVGPEKRHELVFFGIAEDVVLASEIFRELQAAVSEMARTRYGSLFRGDGRDYAEGFGMGLHGYLRELWPNEQYEHLLGNSNKRAMIIANQRELICDQKKEAAEDWIEQQGFRIKEKGERRRRRTASFNGKAFAEGKRDGRAHTPSKKRKPKIAAGGDA